MGQTAEAGSGNAAGKEPQPFEYRTRCRVIRKIADGGMGSVYLAEQIGESGFAKTVALKVIRPDRTDDSKIRSDFVSEAKLVADLVHPNILQVYNLGTVGQQHFIIMEYLHGITLSQLIQRRRKDGEYLPLHWTVYIASRVCRGLAHAHSKRDRQGRMLGIVHRDVAPSNVMLSYTGEVKLSDFGIAQTMFTTSNPRVQAGKLAFMSPEQLRAELIDARSDLYSLGLLLYEALSGVRFFRNYSLEKRRAFHRSGQIPYLKQHRPDLPQKLLDIVTRTLANDPNDRFTSAVEMDDALEDFLYAAYSGDEKPAKKQLLKWLAGLFPEANRNRIE